MEEVVLLLRRMDNSSGHRETDVQLKQFYFLSQIITYWHCKSYTKYFSNL